MTTQSKVCIVKCSCNCLRVPLVVTLTYNSNNNNDARDPLSGAVERYSSFITGKTSVTRRRRRAKREKENFRLFCVCLYVCVHD